MKKNLLLLGLAFAGAAFTGCTQEEADNTGKEPVVCNNPAVLTAQVGGEDATRTSIRPDGRSVQWNAGDVIGVYSDNKAGKIRYRLKDGQEGADKGQFELIAGQDGAIKTVGFSNTEDDRTYVAVYPGNANMYTYKSSPYMDRVLIGAEIPWEQTYTEGSYDKNALPMMAVFKETPAGDMSELKFKYMGSLLELPLAAAEAMKLEKIRVDYVDYRTGRDANPGSHRLATKLAWQFYWDFLNGDTELRDIIFTDMSKPMSYSWQRDPETGAVTKDNLFFHTDYQPVSSGKQYVELVGDIAVSDQVKNIYFGVGPMPFKVAAGRLKFTFYNEDGSIIVKTTGTATENLQCGHIAKLPEYKIALPFMPEIAVEGDKITFTKSDAVKSYTLAVTDWGDPVTEIALTAEQIAAGELSFERDVVPAFNGNNQLVAGTPYEFNLSIKVTYNDSKVAAAVYSVPAKAPVFRPSVPEISISWVPGQSGKPAYVQVNNFNVYGGVDYAIVYINTATEITPEQIAAATFSKMSNKYVFRVEEQFTQGYGNYAIVFQAKNANGDVVKTGTMYRENKAPELPGRPSRLTYDIEKYGGQLNLNETYLLENKDQYGLTAYYAKVKEGKWSSADDFADVDKQFDMKISLYSYYSTGEIMSELVGSDLTHKTYTMMLVMERSEGDPLRGFVQFIYTDPKNPVVEWPAALTFGAFGDEYGGQIDLKEKDLLSDAAAYGVTEYYAEVKEGSFATVEEFDASPNPILGEPHQFKINPNTYNTSDEVLATAVGSEYTNKTYTIKCTIKGGEHSASGIAGSVLHSNPWGSY